MTVYGIIIKKIRKANTKKPTMQCHKDLKGFYAELHDYFLFEGFSQQLIAKWLVTQTLTAHH